MSAKLNDLLTSGVVWVADESATAFVSYANANGVFMTERTKYNGGVVFILKKVYVR